MKYGGKMNLLEILARGGWVMIFIGLASVVGLAIFVERIRVLRKAKINYATFLMRLPGQSRRRGIESGRRAFSENDSPVARVMEKGIKMINRTKEELREAIDSAGRAEIYGLERGMGILGTVAGVAPLIGFLGTVTGMIQAFMKIEELGGNVNATVLAGGIWEALITTAAGLIVGIPALIGYNYLIGKVKRFVLEIEQSSQNLLETVSIVKKEIRDEVRK